MSNIFSLPELFRNSFGYELPPKFEIPAAPSNKLVSKRGQPFYSDDIYGREMFMPVTLSGAFQAGNMIVPFNYQIPFAVLSISVKKTIISEALPEHRGSVHEIINTEDYIIDIKGLIIRPDNEWPEDEISMLNQIFNINNSVTMRSALTDIFLDGAYNHSVILKSLDFPANPGVQHAKPFYLQCESDSIFTLELE